MKNAIVEVEDLTMAYQEQPVLWDIDVKIMKGSRTAIIGPNGAGKSTLIKGILELEKPLSGRVSILGTHFDAIKNKVAYIPQASEVNWDFPTTVEDVVLMGRYVHLGWIKRPRKIDYEKAHQALKEIGIYEYKDRQISQLSGGQRQRVFIARAIAQEAEIYFMDEPLAGVDKRTERIFIDFVKRIQQKGHTSIVVHHDLNTIKQYFDHVIILNKRLIAAGPTEEVFVHEHLVKANMTWGGEI
ncbi:metal ABC transporter ATP-binding protein [Facklamia sp. P13055]|uniref:metal ABC transporter ATP-binding protein n=1 Tax=unclassified Facklamia TaxID=2622293 RepID=UPI003D1811E4